MNDKLRHETAPTTLFLAVLCGLSSLVGLAFTQIDTYIARLLLMEVLQPGRETYYLLANGNFWPFRFAVTLWFIGFSYVALPGVVAWLVTRNAKDFVKTVVLVLVLSVSVSFAAFIAYRFYMQSEITTVMYGVVRTTTRGVQMSVGYMPVAKLALCGPLLIGALTLLRGAEHMALSGNRPATDTAGPSDVING